MNLTEKTKVEFSLYRHGDSISLPRVGFVRTPCKFVVAFAEKDSIINILRGLGYRDDQFRYKILYGEEIEQTNRSKSSLIKETPNLDISINHKLGKSLGG